MTDKRFSNVVRLFVIGSDQPALVDAEFAHLAKYRWKLRADGTVIREAEKVVKLPRVIVGAGPGQGVVHRDGNKLDNRRANLIYPCSAAEVRVHQALLNRTATRDLWETEIG